MHTRMMNLVVLAALACSAMVGCKGQVTKVDRNAPSDTAKPVVIQEGVTGDSSALDAFAQYHIETQAQYDALGDANIFPGGLDFEIYDLVIVALGKRSTGGYAIQIDSIQVEAGKLLVNGKASAPADAATQAVSYPYAAVVIPNTSASSIVPYID